MESAMNGHLWHTDCFVLGLIVLARARVPFNLTALAACWSAGDRSKWARA